MRSRSTQILRYFFYVVILLLGIVIGMAIRHYRELPLSAEINLVDMATLIVTVFLAVYIPEVLDHRLENAREKKNLIHGRISEFQGLLKKVNTLVQEEGDLNEKNYLVVENTLDVLRHKLDTVTSLLGYANLKNTFEKELGHLRRLTLQYEKLLEIEPGNTVFRFSKEIQDQEEKLYDQIDKACTILIFRIYDA